MLIKNAILIVLPFKLNPFQNPGSVTEGRTDGVGGRILSCLILDSEVSYIARLPASSLDGSAGEALGFNHSDLNKTILK